MAAKTTRKSRMKRTAKNASEWSTAKKLGVTAALVAVPVAAAALARAISRKKKSPIRGASAKKH